MKKIKTTHIVLNTIGILVYLLLSYFFYDRDVDEGLIMMIIPMFFSPVLTVIGIIKFFLFRRVRMKNRKIWCLNILAFLIMPVYLCAVIIAFEQRTTDHIAFAAFLSIAVIVLEQTLALFSQRLVL